MIQHPFLPLYNEHSKILILGSFPSVKSREQMFFYGHPQNRFWRVISAVFSAPLPVDIEQKRQFLLSHGIALWDVIGSCDIVGSSDSSIKNVHPNDLSPIFGAADIQKIITNGKAAQKYYDMYTRDKVGRTAVCLPSTSPANAAWTLERLIDEWKRIIKE